MEEGDRIRQVAASGQDVTIYPKAILEAPEHMTIGDSVIIDDLVIIIAIGGVRLGSFIHIGAHSYIGGGGGFEMEDFSGLSGGVRVYTANEDYLGGQLTNPAVPAPWRVATRAPVHIGRHAIIGANTVILPGVTIGEGVAVGANSVVSHDLVPWTICAGSPAKPIRDRPSQRILAMETELRATVYDSAGRYIPKASRREAHSDQSGPF